MNCSYNQHNVKCFNQVRAAGDLCVFHRPANAKGTSEKFFDTFIVTKLKRQETDFRGYIFPWPVTIFDFAFTNLLNLDHTEFLGTLNIQHCQLKGVSAQNIIAPEILLEHCSNTKVLTLTAQNLSKLALSHYQSNDSSLYIEDSEISDFTIRGGKVNTLSLENLTVKRLEIQHFEFAQNLGIQSSQVGDLQMLGVNGGGTLMISNAELNSCEIKGAKVGEFYLADSIVGETRLSLLTSNEEFTIVDNSFKGDLRLSGCKGLRSTVARNTVSAGARIIACEFLDGLDLSQTVSDFVHLLSCKVAGKSFVFSRCTMRDFTLESSLIETSTSLIQLSELSGRFKIHNCTLLSDIQMIEMSFGAGLSIRKTALGGHRFEVIRSEFRGVSIICQSTVSAYTHFDHNTLDGHFRSYDSSFGASTGVNIIMNQRGRSLRSVVSFTRTVLSRHNTFRNFGLTNELSFRYCDLDGVQLLECDMAGVRFVHSKIDSVRLMDCKWPKRRTRLLRLVKSHQLAFEPIDWKAQNALDIGRDAVIQYRQLQHALDASQEYVEAGHFYYNRLETQRRLFAKLTTAHGAHILYRVGTFVKYLVYSMFRIFAGYGEKPGQTVLALLAVWSSLAMIHLYAGFKVNGRIVQGCLPWSPVSSGNLLDIKDISWSFLYSLYHVYPFKSNITIPTLQLQPLSNGLTLPLITSIVLLLMLALVFMSLKRHFKRY
jgi:uncharacterized protein YjbI with pentapeptide repeats